MKLSHVTSDWLHWHVHMCSCAVYGHVCGVNQCHLPMMSWKTAFTLQNTCLWSGLSSCLVDKTDRRFLDSTCTVFSSCFFLSWCFSWDHVFHFQMSLGCLRLRLVCVFFFFCSSDCHRQLLKLISEEGAYYTTSGHLHLLRASPASLHSAVPAAWALQLGSGASRGIQTGA